MRIREGGGGSGSLGRTGLMCKRVSGGERHGIRQIQIQAQVQAQIQAQAQAGQIRVSADARVLNTEC